MSNRKKANKVNAGHKITLGALSVLSIAGGWNIIARAEGSASAEEITSEVPPTPMPTVTPSPTPWPTIAPLDALPPLELRPLPTLSAAGPSFDSAQVSQGADHVFDLPAMSGAAALPTLAPLPALPEYVPPPPPPAQPAAAPSSGGGGGGGGGGSRSKGS